MKQSSKIRATLKKAKEKALMDECQNIVDQLSKSSSKDTQKEIPSNQENSEDHENTDYSPLLDSGADQDLALTPNQPLTVQTDNVTPTSRSTAPHNVPVNTYVPPFTNLQSATYHPSLQQPSLNPLLLQSANYYGNPAQSYMGQRSHLSPTTPISSPITFHSNQSEALDEQVQMIGTSQDNSYQLLDKKVNVSSTLLTT